MAADDYNPVSLSSLFCLRLHACACVYIIRPQLAALTFGLASLFMCDELKSSLSELRALPQRKGGRGVGVVCFLFF